MDHETSETTDATHTSDAHATATEPMNADRDGGWSPWSPPVPPPPTRRGSSWLNVPIARDTDHRRVAGVVAGLSNAYGFDRRTTRIATALGALVVPGIVALYIAGMIFLPGPGAEARTLREIVTDRRRRPLMIVLVVLAIVTGFGSWAFWGGVGSGLALLAIGAVLWLAPNFGRGTAVHERLPIPAEQASHRSTPGPSDAPTTPPSATSSSARSTWSIAPRVRRRRYPVQAVGLGAASVGALVAGVGNSADWWNLSTYSIVLAVLGALLTATVVGAIVNRSWFGLPMLLVLGASTVALAVTHPNLDGGIGERTFRPVTVAGAQVGEHLGIGQLTIDLTRLPDDTQPVHVAASVGYGRIRVLVPADAELEITADVNAGRVVVDGVETSSGVRRDDALTVPAIAAGAGHTIVLEFGVGAGEISVVHARP